MDPYKRLVDPQEALLAFRLESMKYSTLQPCVAVLRKEENYSKARRCAHCLLMCGFPVKICGGCNKRAYCSESCQKADWSNNGNGQHHVNWCRNKKEEYGEEDVDWEIFQEPVKSTRPREALTKKIGIRAKKLISTGYNIIVEPVFTDPNGHQGLEELRPKDGSLEAKFKWNQLKGHPSREGGRNYVALRISLVGNSDNPNAEHHYDETGRVEVLKAIKDIQPGEEILIKSTASSIARSKPERDEFMSLFR